MLLDYSCGVGIWGYSGDSLNLKLDSGMSEQQKSPDTSANRVPILFGCFVIPLGMTIQSILSKDISLRPTLNYPSRKGNSKHQFYYSMVWGSEGINS